MGVATAACLLSKRLRLRKEARALTAPIAAALQELEQMLQPTSLCPDEERERFRSKHAPLNQQATALYQNRWLDQAVKQQVGLLRFVDAYANLNQRVEAANRAYHSIHDVNARLAELMPELYQRLLGGDHYFSFSEKTAFHVKAMPVVQALKGLQQQGYERFVHEPARAQQFVKDCSHLEELRSAHNETFRRNEMAKHKGFFDHLLAYPLDPQQLRAIVTLEDNCLVVSSAGSGKTSTMVGKILYLVERRGVDPSKILTITYTRKAAKELSARLHNDFLRCLTFHKLALDIIAEVSGKKPAIAEESLLVNAFYALMEQTDFKASVLKYIEEYQSAVKNQEFYTSAQDYYADRKKYGVMALYTDMDGKAIFTKSEEEKKICNYLTHLGVSFRYEELYPVDTTNGKYRQYRPDFTIHYMDANGQHQCVYLEHFAIDKDGNVPKWFADGATVQYYEVNRRYNSGIFWKKSLHRQNGTMLIYTTSEDFKAGQVEQKLQSLLARAGVPMRKPSEKELYERIVARNKSLEKSILQMCQAFLMLLKANRKTLEQVKRDAQGSERDTFIIGNIMQPFYELYETMLVDHQQIDFTDAILQAAEYCERGLWKPYEYILVDEFQDISVDRYIFLKALRGSHGQTKLFCVGDDWQSIYRFAGSDMALFSRFSDYFGFTETCKIETTYRFGNPLIEISSDFIQKNPLQVQKDVRPKGDATTLLDFVECSNEPDVYEQVREIISQLPPNESVFIIARYGYDANVLDQKTGRVKNYTDGRVFVNVDGREIPFLTIHSSKGLEADHVLLINCNSGIYGFPSMISDDPVLDYVLSSADEYEFGEERRVFYVGITRAKKHTYVLYDRRMPSVFVTEIHGFNISSAAQLCPVCKAGYKMVVKRGMASNGTRYVNWKCSNTAAGCTYFERVFED